MKEWLSVDTKEKEGSEYVIYYNLEIENHKASIPLTFESFRDKEEFVMRQDIDSYLLICRDRCSDMIFEKYLVKFHEI